MCEYEDNPAVVTDVSSPDSSQETFLTAVSEVCTLQDSNPNYSTSFGTFVCESSRYPTLEKSVRRPKTTSTLNAHDERARLEVNSELWTSQTSASAAAQSSSTSCSTGTRASSVLFQGQAARDSAVLYGHNESLVLGSCSSVSDSVSCTCLINRSAAACFRGPSPDNGRSVALGIVESPEINPAGSSSDSCSDLVIDLISFQSDSLVRLAGSAAVTLHSDTEFSPVSSSVGEALNSLQMTGYDRRAAECHRCHTLLDGSVCDVTSQRKNSSLSGDCSESPHEGKSEFVAESSVPCANASNRSVGTVGEVIELGVQRAAQSPVEDAALLERTCSHRGATCSSCASSSRSIHLRCTSAARQDRHSESSQSDCSPAASVPVPREHCTGDSSQAPLSPPPQRAPTLAGDRHCSGEQSGAQVAHSVDTHDANVTSIGASGDVAAGRNSCEGPHLLNAESNVAVCGKPGATHNRDVRVTECDVVTVRDSTCAALLCTNTTDNIEEQWLSSRLVPCKRLSSPPRPSLRRYSARRASCAKVPLGGGSYPKVPMSGCGDSRAAVEAGGAALQSRDVEGPVRPSAAVDTTAAAVSCASRRGLAVDGDNNSTISAVIQCKRPAIRLHSPVHHQQQHQQQPHCADSLRLHSSSPTALSDAYDVTSRAQATIQCRTERRSRLQRWLDESPFALCPDGGRSLGVLPPAADTSEFIGGECEKNASVWCSQLGRSVWLPRRHSGGRAKQRRHRVEYSSREVHNLCSGVLRYGWDFKTIRSAYWFHPQRTPSDLYDKYRHMQPY